MTYIYTIGNYINQNFRQSKFIHTMVRIVYLFNNYGNYDDHAGVDDDKQYLLNA